MFEATLTNWIQPSDCHLTISALFDNHLSTIKLGLFLQEYPSQSMPSAPSLPRTRPEQPSGPATRRPCVAHRQRGAVSPACRARPVEPLAAMQPRGVRASECSHTVRASPSIINVSCPLHLASWLPRSSPHPVPIVRPPRSLLASLTTKEAQNRQGRASRPRPGSRAARRLRQPRTDLPAHQTAPRCRPAPQPPLTGGQRRRFPPEQSVLTQDWLSAPAPRRCPAVRRCCNRHTVSTKLARHRRLLDSSLMLYGGANRRSADFHILTHFEEPLLWGTSAALHETTEVLRSLCWSLRRSME